MKKLKFTHNDINEGDMLSLKHLPGTYKVLALIDGYSGIQVQHHTDRDPMWIDVAEVTKVRRTLVGG